MRFPLALLLLLLPAACGDLPRPFAGNPGATATRLAQPPPARLVVLLPPAAFLPGAAGTSFAGDIAAALVAQEVPAFAESPRPGDWRLSTAAQPRPDGIVPVYTVQDPAGISQGVTEGLPLSAEALGAAASPVLQQAASDAASRIAALLTRINAARAQSDPNSLVNRPARVSFAGVTGAPGDGNTSLARQMRSEMTKAGQPMQDSTGDADFTVACNVVTAPLAGNQMRVEIQWIVKDAKGVERGRVVQLNEIPAGTLDHFWGDVALVVAQEAAGGVRDVIRNQTGAKR